MPWYCTGCGADSHKPAKDELVVCPKCGTQGCMERRDKQKVRESRDRLVALIVEQVLRDGHAHVDEGITDRLDDKPEHPIAEVARMFEEGIAQREGRRPHLEAPKTFLGELRRVCAERGWEMAWNSRLYLYDIVAPMRRLNCKACDGCGRIRENVKFEHIDMSLGLGSQVIQQSICAVCGGRGYIETRSEL